MNPLKMYGGPAVLGMHLGRTLLIMAILLSAADGRADGGPGVDEAPLTDKDIETLERAGRTYAPAISPAASPIPRAGEPTIDLDSNARVERERQNRIMLQYYLRKNPEPYDPALFIYLE